MLNGLDLFSGIGGLSLALEEWVRPIAYCENDRYAQAVLLSRIRSGQLPLAPIWDDIRTLSGKWVPPVDIIYGGFPCQDLSAAGAGRGLVGERSGLFWQIERLVKETNPKYVFLENVPAIRTRGLNTVIQSFVEFRYDCRWTVVSAGEVGASVIRKRWFLLAKSNGPRLERLEPRKELWAPQRLASNLVCKKIQSQDINSLARDGNELPIPMDQIRGLGNAVVPTQAKEAFKRLMGLE